jgi:hypothetical protein
MAITGIIFTAFKNLARWKRKSRLQKLRRHMMCGSCARAARQSHTFKFDIDGK